MSLCVKKTFFQILAFANLICLSVGMATLVPQNFVDINTNPLGITPTSIVRNSIQSTIDISIGVTLDDSSGTDAGIYHRINLVGNQPVIAQTLRNGENFPMGTLSPGDEFGAALTGDFVFSAAAPTFDSLIGAPGHNNDQGAVYWTVWNLSPVAFVSHALITDGQTNFLGTLVAGDRFGSSLVSFIPNDDGSDLVVIGAPGSNRGGTNSGTVWVLELLTNRSLSSNQLEISPATLGISGNLDNLGLGTAVSIFSQTSTEYLALTAPGFNGQTGAVFIIEFDRLLFSTVSPSFQLSSTTAGVTLEANARFGQSILSASNGQLIVGAPGSHGGTGSLWVFSFDTANFSAPLSAVEILSFPGLEFAADEQFGLGLGFDNSQNVFFALTRNHALVVMSELCGDNINSQEPCDDGNNVDGDGCNSICRVELGFECTPNCVPICGDGLTVNGETCDDGGTINNDGCSGTCTLEAGFVCTNSTANTTAASSPIAPLGPTMCSSVCGDGLVVGTEQCDGGADCNSECRRKGSSLNGGEIAGIVIAVLIVCCVIVFLGVAVVVVARRAGATDSALTQEQIILQTFKDTDLICLLKDVEVGKIVGSGNFGQVFAGRWQGTDVALKGLKGQSMTDMVHELSVLNDLRHPNVLYFYGVYFHQGELFMVTEFMEHGDLLTFLRKRYELTQSALSHISSQAANGMSYLHSKDIIHRDLAARNLLVSGDAKTLTVKVADFGLSRKTETYYTAKEDAEIPIRWSAPETLEFGKFSKPSDVWSFGIVLWEIFSRGGVPYAGMGNSKVIKQVQNGYRLRTPLDMPMHIAGLMRLCTSLDPEGRPTFDEIYSFLQFDDTTSQGGSTAPAESFMEPPTENKNKVQAPQVSSQMLDNPEVQKLLDYIGKLHDRLDKQEQELQALRGKASLTNKQSWTYTSKDSGYGNSRTLSTLTEENKN